MSETAKPASTNLANLPEFSVGELSAALKATVESTFPLVRVRGEISGLKRHSSGHLYFDLKDEKAVLNAVIWKGMARALKITPEAGLEVICTGRISTYAGSSRYQIIVEQVELAGLGALMALLNARKAKLAAEGLFDAAHKKKLPFLPEMIGVVTSPTGAVIRDIMHRLNARFPRRVMLWPVAVQGERAAGEIAAAIAGFNALPQKGAVPRPDLIIVARGGGSVEDLMPFNEETVVRAAYESAIPLISAVGHETDTTLIDFAADVRAPTPTAAAELAVPVRAELLVQILDYERRMLRQRSKSMEDRRHLLVSLARVLPKLEQLFAGPRQRLDLAVERLGHALDRNFQFNLARFRKTLALLRPRPVLDYIRLGRERESTLAVRVLRAHAARVAEKRRHLDALSRILEGISYRAVLERGFALVRGSDGAVRRRAQDIALGEHISLTFSDGAIAARAEGRPISPKAKAATKPPGTQGSLF